jgi:peptidoglycan L-alanyl-D-glutamate endopeptidase CwlK
MALDHPTIAKILGAPLANVESNWPLIQGALTAAGIGSQLVQVAALATLGVEADKPGLENPSDFTPCRELSPRGQDRRAYFIQRYWTNPTTRHNLGNLTPDDAAAYFGRGFIQLTGRDNYQVFGDLLGVDLLNHPDLALDPAISARIFAEYFRRRRVAEAAEARDWFRVRLRVNGGSNGWDRFSELVQQLQAVA